MITSASSSRDEAHGSRRWYSHGAFVFVVGFVLVGFLPGALFAAIAQPNNEDWIWLAAAVILGGFAYLVYRFVIVGVLERRPPVEVAFRADVLGQGLALGLVLFGLVLGLIAALGGVSIRRPQPWLPAAAAALAVGLGPALIEELFYRGIVFRRLQDWLGSWVALVVSALLFGALHATNPSASPWSVLCVIIAGTTFAALYVWSGSLWLPIGAHLIWNSAQAFFGVPVSGNPASGPLSTAFAGPGWLTGDATGMETSVFTPLVWGGVAAVALVLAVRNGRIVRSRRQRERQPLPAE